MGLYRLQPIEAVQVCELLRRGLPLDYFPAAVANALRNGRIARLENHVRFDGLEAGVEDWLVVVGDGITVWGAREFAATYAPV